MTKTNSSQGKDLSFGKIGDIFGKIADLFGGKGGKSTNSVNNPAVIGDPTVSSVTEDAAVNAAGNLTASGKISISDADKGQAVFVSHSGAADNLGTLAFQPDGSYTYTVSNAAAQFLGAGHTKVDSFTVVSADGTSKVVKFTVNGVNDAAVIGNPTVSSVTEDTAVNAAGNLTASGKISISDVDQGQAHFVSHAGAADNLGTLAFQPDGSYTYTVSNAAAQFLGAGHTKVDSFTVVSADGTSKVVKFTVNGVNDAAVIGNPTVSSVTEDTAVNAAGNLTASGKISISDVDQGQAHFVSHAGAADNLGTLAFQPDGSYTYTVSNAAAQFLGAGHTKVDSFTVVSADGTSKVVKFTVNGVNDAAVIGNPTVSSVTEDTAVNAAGNLTASGKISISDVDQGQAHFVSHAGAADNLGTLAFQPDGSYTYTVSNAAVQFLGAGATKVDSFTVVSADGTSKVVKFTVNGVNDAAVIGNPTVSSVTEDTAVNAAGNLTASGKISISDADLFQAYFVSHSGAADNIGTLAFQPDGSYTYTVSNAAVQFLGAGDTKVDSFTVVSADGTSKVVKFTVNGTNDAAVIGNPNVTRVIENVGVNAAGFLEANGTITISDVDQGEARFVGATGAAGNVGTLDLNADGTYTYRVDNSTIQSLADCQSKIDTFTVTSVDGTTKDVFFTVNGSEKIFDDAQNVIGVVSGDEIYNFTGTEIVTLNDLDNRFIDNTTDTIGRLILGLGGNDRIGGQGGADILLGQAGNDTLAGDGQNDWLFGGTGNDTLLGNPGVDHAFGGDGNDTIFGGFGKDFLFGGCDNDTLVADEEDDIVSGGTGSDTFVFARGRGLNGNDTIIDFEISGASLDRIDLKGFGTSFDTFAEIEAAMTQVGSDTLIQLGVNQSVIILDVAKTDLDDSFFLFA